MPIQSQVTGLSGAVAEVKGASVAPLTTDPALVVLHRPDDPIITALRSDTNVVGAGAQTALGQNILNIVPGAGATDMTNYRSISFSVIPAAGAVTTGAITFEVSSDSANWVVAPMIDKAAPGNAPISVYTIVANTPRHFTGKTLFRYFRIRISTAITGATSGVQCFASMMGESADFTIMMARITDGTNVMPTMDSAARAGYQRFTDGTNAVAVKAASVAPVAADPAMVVALSPNLPVQSVFVLESAASTNATLVKASAGRLMNMLITNTSAATKFVKLFNKASAPTVGTDVPIHTIVVPAASSIQVDFGMLGKYFTTGIAYSITNLIGNLDATNIVAGDVKITGDYI